MCNGQRWCVKSEMKSPVRRGISKRLIDSVADKFNGLERPVADRNNVKPEVGYAFLHEVPLFFG